MVGTLPGTQVPGVGGYIISISKPKRERKELLFRTYFVSVDTMFQLKITLVMVGALTMEAADAPRCDAAKAEY